MKTKEAKKVRGNNSRIKTKKKKKGGEGGRGIDREEGIEKRHSREVT